MTNAKKPTWYYIGGVFFLFGVIGNLSIDGNKWAILLWASLSILMFIIAYKKNIKYKEEIESQKNKFKEESADLVSKKNLSTTSSLFEQPINNRKIKNKGAIIFVTSAIILIIIFYSYRGSNSSKSTVVIIPKTNIDSIINQVKNDKLFEVKDVYYNEKDSSFNIAFTNKDNVIKDANYSTLYFNNTYHINSFSCFDGIYLYAYKKGKFLKNGDYKEYLTCESKRAARLLDAFKENYCIRDIECTALSGILKKQLNDPNSYESQKIYVEWLKDDKFKVTNEFRAKNAFGALILNKCSAIIDGNGNVYDLKFEN